MVELIYDVEFASQAMTEIPLGYIDKTIPGCGLTTVALENHLDTVIAVPNVELIENKISQYPNGRCKYTILGVKSGISGEGIDKYVDTVKSQGYPLKIMVTFDSLPKVKRHLRKYETCRLIIDESQELLRYSKLKAQGKRDAYGFDVISYVFNTAHSFEDRVSFVSATPIKLKYMPDWISDLDQVTIKWSNTAKVNPISMKRSFPKKALINEILNPIEENGSVTKGGMTFSKAIIFVKSLAAIKTITDRSLISRKDIRIIMGKNEENDIYMQGFNRLEDYGNLPKYTFITGSGFKGIDLYDENAVNIVISDVGKDFTMIDLRTDLRQAISRQRSKSNPNYGKFLFIYNQTLFKLSEEELLAKVEDIKSDVEIGLDYHFSIMLGSGKKRLFDRYIAIDEKFKEYALYDKAGDCFIFNKDLYNSDIEFILETRKAYEEGFNIRAEFKDSMNVGKESVIESPNYDTIQKHYRENGNFGEYDMYTEYVNIIKTCEKYFDKTFSNLQYAKRKIDEHNNEVKSLINKVQAKFKINERYTNFSIKETLQCVYDDNDISKKAKAKDISYFMETEPYKYNGTRGFKIISKKL